MCIFCSIEPTKLVLSSAKSFVIVNKYPLGIMSFLSISRVHAKSLTDLSQEEAIDLWQVTNQLLSKIKRIYNPEGINVFINEGGVAGQTIPHLHIHIVIRGAADNLQNYARIGETEALTNEEAAEIKKKILKRGP